MTHIITTGLRNGPLMTKRGPGETLKNSFRRHREQVAVGLPKGDQLVTICQLPGGQGVLATTRRAGESDEEVRGRHLARFPIG